MAGLDGAEGFRAATDRGVEGVVDELVRPRPVEKLLRHGLVEAFEGVERGGEVGLVPGGEGDVLPVPALFVAGGDLGGVDGGRVGESGAEVAGGAGDGDALDGEVDRAHGRVGSVGGDGGAEEVPGAGVVVLVRGDLDLWSDIEAAYGPWQAWGYPTLHDLAVTVCGDGRPQLAPA